MDESSLLGALIILQKNPHCFSGNKYFEGFQRTKLYPWSQRLTMKPQHDQAARAFGAFK